MNRLKELREQNNYTKTEVAKQIEMEFSNYSKYERGDKNIGSKTIKKLCILYNISADYLLGLIDEPRKLK